jgi:hypothetical protein
MSARHRWTAPAFSAPCARKASCRLHPARSRVRDEGSQPPGNGGAHRRDHTWWPTKIKLVDFDSDEKLIKLPTDGTIVALVVQDPYRMGYDSIKTALGISKAEKGGGERRYGANFLTKENMNSPPFAGTPEPEGGVVGKRKVGSVVLLSARASELGR